MAITLFTGVPGAGKTLRSIFEGLEKKGEGRQVFHIGIDGMKPDVIPPSPVPIDEWFKLPAGSVLIVDEAHKYFPVRQPGRPPEWIQKLTEIRHFGIELFLITQDPRNIDAFVRRLVGEHKHLSRKAGLNGAMIRTFQGVSEDPNDYTNRQSSQQAPWKYPKHLFQVYESATLHVVKPKIPKKILFAVLLFLACLIGLPYVLYKFKNTVSDLDSVAGVGSTTAIPASGFTPSSGKAVAFDTLDEYVKATTPLSPVAPWTAPIYKDVLKVSKVPAKLACYIGSRGCRCFTEQMTRVRLPEPVCVSLVKDGIYSPYHDAYEKPPTAWGERVAAPAVGLEKTTTPISPGQVILSTPPPGGG